MNVERKPFDFDLFKNKHEMTKRMETMVYEIKIFALCK